MLLSLRRSCASIVLKQDICLPIAEHSLIVCLVDANSNFIVFFTSLKLKALIRMSSHNESKPSSVPDTSSGSKAKGGSLPIGAGTCHGDGAKMTSAHILLNPNPICLAILSVRIKVKGGTHSIEGYAFLDNCSTVFLECLVDQLGAEATPTILNCETMNATTCEECVTLDLRIENHDGSGFVECTGYSRKDLSVDNKSNPTKEQIQKYSHLKKVDFQELPD
jgi:hypothetical protein